MSKQYIIEKLLGERKQLRLEIKQLKGLLRQAEIAVPKDSVVTRDLCRRIRTALTEGEEE